MGADAGRQGFRCPSRFFAAAAQKDTRGGGFPERYLGDVQTILTKPDSRRGMKEESPARWAAGAAAPAPAVRRRENLRSASFRDYAMGMGDPCTQG